MATLSNTHRPLAVVVIFIISLFWFQSSFAEGIRYRQDLNQVNFFKDTVGTKKLEEIYMGADDKIEGMHPMRIPISTFDRFYVCYSTGCPKGSYLSLSEAMQSKVRALFNGADTPKKERGAIIQALAEIRSYVGPLTNTHRFLGFTFNMMAYGYRYEGRDRPMQGEELAADVKLNGHHQDCWDNALNATTQIFMLYHDGLLKFHRPSDIQFMYADVIGPIDYQHYAGSVREVSSPNLDFVKPDPIGRIMSFKSDDCDIVECLEKKNEKLFEVLDDWDYPTWKKFNKTFACVEEAVNAGQSKFEQLGCFGRDPWTFMLLSLNDSKLAEAVDCLSSSTYRGRWQFCMGNLNVAKAEDEESDQTYVIDTYLQDATKLPPIVPIEKWVKGEYRSYMRWSLLPGSRCERIRRVHGNNNVAKNLLKYFKISEEQCPDGVYESIFKDIQ